MSSNTWSSAGIANSARMPASATPVSVASSSHTYTLPASPVKGRKPNHDNYKPLALKTCGSRPACLVNASVTYCGNNSIYAFGGFDQYTDEVYNHVLKLDLGSMQWNLVDNYGDIPGVRMGHTACLWQGDKLLIHGGENEHRDYLSDVIIFDLKTSTWRLPDVSGPIPKGRARHAAVIHDEKLFILGGLSGPESYTLDEISYLDLRTWTWSRSWSFVPRFDHSAWVWGGRLWVFGGLGPDMERTSELWWLDLKSSPVFKTTPEYGPLSSQVLSRARLNQQQYNTLPSTIGSTTGYTANSSSVQVRSSSYPRSMAPGAISSMKFISGANIPSQVHGVHFHMYSSGALLDFTCPTATTRTSECNLSTLELDTMQWQKLAEGGEMFDSAYRWHYCAMNEDGTKAWLLGTLADTMIDPNSGIAEEYLSDILTIDLKRYGLLGNDSVSTSFMGLSSLPISDRHTSSHLGGLGADLASMFDQRPTADTGGDFIVTAERDDASDSTTDCGLSQESNTSRPIHVHKLILQARWPHFTRLYQSQMAEFHTKKMHIEEPYSVVRAFLYYLYTDSIAKHDEYCPSLTEVAGMLVMSNIYDMPRLRLLCINRLSRELDIESAATIWERAGVAGEDWLRKRAASFCLTHWGRLVRTEGFRRLSQQNLVELCSTETDLESRVVGAEELEVVGALGGGRIGAGVLGRGPGKHRGSMSIQMGEEYDDGEDDEGMEMN